MPPLLGEFAPKSFALGRGRHSALRNAFLKDASANAERCEDVIRNGVTLILGRAGEPLELACLAKSGLGLLGVFFGQLGDIHGYTASFAAREQL
jgi:hypothetical protein